MQRKSSPLSTSPGSAFSAQQSIGVPTDWRGLRRHLILGFFFERLACQSALDLKGFCIGRVAQHLRARVLGVELLIISRNGLLTDHRGLPGVNSAPSTAHSSISLFGPCVSVASMSSWCPFSDSRQVCVMSSPLKHGPQRFGRSSRCRGLRKTQEWQLKKNVSYGLLSTCYQA